MNTAHKAILRFMLLGVLIAVGCADQSADPQPMRVGVIVTLTGPARSLGEPERDILLDMEADRGAFNGITLDIRDSGGDPARARMLLDTFAADPEIVAVIGPSTSAESLEIAPLADSLEIALLSLAAHNRIVLDQNGATRQWVFKFAQNDNLAAERVAAAMRANGHTTAALFFSDDVFGNGGAQAFRAAAGTTIQITNDIKYASLLEDGTAAAAQISPDVPAVVVWGTTPGPALVVKALRARGYTGQIYLSHGNASVMFLEDAGAAAEGAYVVGSRLLMPTADLDPGVREDAVILNFHTRSQRVGRPPSTFGGHAHDALEAIISAAGSDLRNMDASGRRAQLRDRLEQLHGLLGVTGTFSFSPTDHAGLTPDAFALYRVENRTFVVVED